MGQLVRVADFSIMIGKQYAWKASGVVAVTAVIGMQTVP